MNTRGLMEPHRAQHRARPGRHLARVVRDDGDHGVVTTMATSPILVALVPNRRLARDTRPIRQSRLLKPCNAGSGSCDKNGWTRNRVFGTSRLNAQS